MKINSIPPLLRDKISTALRKECRLDDEAQVLDYMNNRKNSILKNHITNVCRIYLPGEAGQNYYMTKLTPQKRNHATKIYAHTKEELENKIIAYYLGIKSDSKLTVRKLLIKALGGDEENMASTPKRTLQRFDKNLKELGDLKVSSLNETEIRKSLDRLVESKPTVKEFNETITSLNKIADYCDYEHIEMIDIRKIIAVYRQHKLTGHHIWKTSVKQTKDLAFTLEEVSEIVRYALNNPSYKALSVAILITTGLRIGELLALEVKDIYLIKSYLWIHQCEDSQTYEIHPYTKGDRPRQVSLTAEARLVIRAALDFRKNDPTESPYLVLNGFSEDGKMHLRAVDDFMRTTLHHTILGYDHEREARSPHDCRRTYATLEYLNGTDIKVIKMQLGHKTEAQTWEYIVDVAEFAQRQDKLKGIGLNLTDFEPVLAV